MGILRRFDRPAFLSDFRDIAGLYAWHQAVSNWFDSSTDSDRSLVSDGKFQFTTPHTSILEVRSLNKRSRGMRFQLNYSDILGSIEEQFEFLTARRMSDSSRPKMPAGHHLLIGQNDSSTEGRLRVCAVFGRGLQ